MKAIVGLLALVVLLSFSACSDSTGKPSYLFKPAPKEGLAAKVGSMEITNAELADGIESDLFEAETKVFEIKFARLKSLLLQKYMDKDPRKKGISNDEFLEKYIAKEVVISDKEIDAFIKDQNIPAEHINPQVREKIKNYLEMERKKEAVDKWIAEQTKKDPVEVYIPKPRRPTFPVEVGNAPTTGAKDAKVTIIEFSDFQCPFCAKGADILKEIKKKYGNKVLVAFKNFPLPFHNHAEQAAVAGLCANEQGSDYFWKMHDEMFANQDSLDAEGLKKTAKKIGLKSEAFEKCLSENKFLAQVKADMEQGKNVKVKSTPTFFINGQLINGAQPMDVFAEIIDEELAR
ncbi:DsbA family protein [Peredibacter starrii]|uniref:DsbA family protein n=1 Tax=Peredibacter starrii TaxID=28202 RepID=A0AAX4HMW6_9BACT|nr:DsbA family protein [Peredibacter starrii]WPU64520.1 DsbA family protein [Peredibacter starrii]